MWLLIHDGIKLRDDMMTSRHGNPIHISSTLDRPRQLTWSSNAFWMKTSVFWVKFHWILFPKIKFMISWFWSPTHWPIYASPCFIDLQLNPTAWHGEFHDDVINGNILQVTGPLWGETTGHRWIPPIKGQWRGALMFSLICAWTSNWANNQNAGDLKHYCVHYGVTLVYYQLACTSTRPMKYLEQGMLFTILHLGQGMLLSMWKDITLSQTGISVRCLFSSTALATHWNWLFGEVIMVFETKALEKWKLAMMLQWSEHRGFDPYTGHGHLSVFRGLCAFTCVRL